MMMTDDDDVSVTVVVVVVVVVGGGGGGVFVMISPMINLMEKISKSCTLAMFVAEFAAMSMIYHHIKIHMLCLNCSLVTARKAKAKHSFNEVNIL
jgi:hypothetical protein